MDLNAITLLKVFQIQILIKYNNQTVTFNFISLMHTF